MFDTETDLFAYILAGKATLTLRSKVTGNHYTYRVSRLDDPQKHLWFVSILTGPNNISDYTYIGVIEAEGEDEEPRFRTTAKTKDPESKGVRGFGYFANRLFNSSRSVFDQMEVSHIGKCGRCARPLTDPESIRMGLGPICRGA